MVQNRKTHSKKLLPKEYNKKTVFINLDTNLALYLAEEHLKKNKIWVKTKHQYYRDIAFAFYYPNLVKEDKGYIRQYLLNNNFMVHDLTSFDNFTQFDQFSSYDNVVLGECITYLSNFYNIETYYFFLKQIERLAQNGMRMFYLSQEYNFDPTLDCVYNADSLSNATHLVRGYAVISFMDKLFSHIKSYNKYPLYRIMLPIYYNIFKDDEYSKIDNLPQLTTDMNDYRHPQYKEFADLLFNTKMSFMSTDIIAKILYEMFYDNEFIEAQNYLINSNYKRSITSLRKNSLEKMNFGKYEIKTKTNYNHKIIDHTPQEYYEQFRKNNDKYEFHLRKTV